MERQPGVLESTPNQQVAGVCLEFLWTFDSP